VLKLKGYWAGQLVLTRTIAKATALPLVLDELARAIGGGTLTHTTVGMTVVLDRLSVDVYKKNVLFKMFQLKK
jgi:hypothetical protein